jgi:hypothetical protein
MGETKNMSKQPFSLPRAAVKRNPKGTCLSVPVSTLPGFLSIYPKKEVSHLSDEALRTMVEKLKSALAAATSDESLCLDLTADLNLVQGVLDYRQARPGKKNA